MYESNLYMDNPNINSLQIPTNIYALGLMFTAAALVGSLIGIALTKE